jgi:alpha-1,3-rhamnosyltransferase
MTIPSVTVLVPSYNHAPFIERTLRSIFKQSLPPKKLIVIDDGSKDESVTVIERALAECPFDNHLIIQENKGLSATLNKGFALSNGEYFAYLGSDDVWLPQFLEKRTALLESRPSAVLAFGHAYLIDEDDRIIDNTQSWTSFADGDLLPFLLRGEIPASPTVVYRAVALKNERWNENAALEDYELYLKLCKQGEFALDSSVLSAWRQHGWNTSSDFPLMIEEWIAAQDRTLDKLGMTRAELDKVQTELRFNTAFEYVRHGRKKEAFRLMRENLSGAGSPVRVAQLLMRLATPKSLFAWNRKRKKERSIQRHGKLNI